MIVQELDFVIPDYVLAEIKEYIEETQQGRCRCMKWQNIRALLRLAMVNGRITYEQVLVVEKAFYRENKNYK